MKNIDRRRPWSTRYPSNAVEESWRATYWGEQRRECHVLEYRKSSARAQSSVRFDSPSPSILSFHSFIRDNHNKYKTSVSSVGRSRTRMMCLSVLSDSKRAYKITWNLQFFSPPLYCMEWHNEKRQKRWKENNSWSLSIKTVLIDSENI